MLHCTYPYPGRYRQMLVSQVLYNSRYIASNYVYFKQKKRKTVVIVWAHCPLLSFVIPLPSYCYWFVIIIPWPCSWLLFVIIIVIPPTIHLTSSCSWGWRWLILFLHCHHHPLSFHLPPHCFVCLPIAFFASPPFHFPSPIILFSFPHHFIFFLSVSSFFSSSFSHPHNPPWKQVARRWGAKVIPLPLSLSSVA